MADTSGGAVFGMELALWDTLLLPIFMTIMAKVSTKARNFFSAMKLQTDCCGKK